MTPDQERVWRAVNAIYAGYLAADRESIDANISLDATVWDSSHEALLRSKEQLDAVRDARPTDGPKPGNLDEMDPVIDVYGDIAIVRHVLVVTFPPEASLPQQRIRNTSVWRKTDGRWLCIHNHEDVVS